APGPMVPAPMTPAPATQAPATRGPSAGASPRARLTTRTTRAYRSPGAATTATSHGTTGDGPAAQPGSAGRDRRGRAGWPVWAGRPAALRVPHGWVRAAAAACGRGHLGDPGLPGTRGQLQPG